MTLTSDLSPTRRALLSRTVLAVTSLVVPFGQASGQPARSPLNGAAVLTGSLRSSPEARLIAVYHAIAAGDRQALPLAASLVRDVPGFQLGQLLAMGFDHVAGSTGNASPDGPHLHFSIFRLGIEKRWWEGTAINPFPLWDITGLP